MVQLQCFRKTLVMQGLSACIQPTTLDKLFKFRPVKAGRSALQLRRTRNDRSVARSQLKTWGEDAAELFGIV